MKIKSKHQIWLSKLSILQNLNPHQKVNTFEDIFSIKVLLSRYKKSVKLQYERLLAKS